MLVVYQYDLMAKAMIAIHSRKDIPATKVNMAYFI
jgi:hypothetical protein